MPYPAQTPPQPPIQFPQQPAPPRPPSHPWLGRWAFGLYGLMLGLLLVFVVGCSVSDPSTAEPGTGPAASQPADEPSETEPADPSGTVTGSFKQKLVYPDGVAVEVTRIKHAKLSESGVGDKGQVAGDPIQVLSIRVTNGSKAAVQVDAASGTMTYGPDGDEASTVFDTGINGMSGKVLPGKAKTGTYGFAVPAKYQGDAVLEFSFDFDHGSAIFTGSIK